MAEDLEAKFRKLAEEAGRYIDEKVREKLGRVDEGLDERILERIDTYDANKSARKWTIIAGFALAVLAGAFYFNQTYSPTAQPQTTQEVQKPVDPYNQFKIEYKKLLIESMPKPKKGKKNTITEKDKLRFEEKLYDPIRDQITISPGEIPTYDNGQDVPAGTLIGLIRNYKESTRKITIEEKPRPQHTIR